MTHADISKQPSNSTLEVTKLQHHMADLSQDAGNLQEATPLIQSSTEKNDYSIQNVDEDRKSDDAGDANSKTIINPIEFELKSSILSSLQRVLPDPERKYNMWVGIIFSLNYTFGTGVLGLPNEFFAAGYVLSVLLILWCGVITYALCIKVGDLVYRGEAITSLMTQHCPTLSQSDYLDKPEIIMASLLHNNNSVSIGLFDFENEYKKGINRNEYQLGYLVGLFCGHKWRIVYEYTFCVQEILSLWGYNVLFGASMARFGGISGISDSCNIGQYDEGSWSDCRSLYTFYNCMFWIWCIGLVLMNFKQQTGIQLTSFCARVVIILIMIITSIGLLYGNLEYSSSSGRYSKTSDSSSSAHYGTNVSAFKFSGLIYFIASAFSAFNCQFAVPDIIQPLTRTDRSKISFIFGTNIMALIIIWCFVCICVSVYFGNDTEDPCTLAWKYFRGFSWNNGDRPGWSYVIAYIVLLLPPINMMSSFPLNCITLCNTIEQSLFDMEKISQATTFNFKENGNNHDIGNSSARENTNIVVNVERYLLIRRVCLRISVVSLSTIMGLLAWEYETVIVLSGIFALIGLYFIPTYAGYKSKQVCNSIGNNRLTYKTPVTNWVSHVFWDYATYATCFIGIIGVIYELAT